MATSQGRLPGPWGCLSGFSHTLVVSAGAVQTPGKKGASPAPNAVRGKKRPAPARSSDEEEEEEDSEDEDGGENQEELWGSEDSDAAMVDDYGAASSSEEEEEEVSNSLGARSTLAFPCPWLQGHPWAGERGCHMSSLLPSLLAKVCL